MSRIKLVAKLRPSRPVITANSSVSGDAGASLSISFTVNRDGTASLEGSQADMFVIQGGSVLLLDTSTAGTYTVTLAFHDTNGLAAPPKTLTFTVNEAEALPTLAMTLSAVDSYTLQCTFDDNAAYTSYQAAINQNYDQPRALSSNKRVIVEIAGIEYEAQVRGVTSGGEFGPWSDSEFVTTPADPGEPEPGTQAIMADAFVDTIGINATLNFQSTSSPYHANFEDEWMPDLKASGIRYVRTAFNNHATVRGYINDLWDNHGVKFQFLMNPVTNGEYDTAMMQTLLNIAKGSNYGTEMILNFEGPNEVQAHINDTGLGWAQKTINFQQTFYNAVRNDSAFNDVEVGGPSLWGRSITAGDEVLALNSGLGWSPYCDWQPAHIYTGSLKPTVGAPPEDDNEAGNPITDPSAQLSLAEIIESQSRLADGKPCEITECGYKADGTGVTKDRGQIISTATQSKFISRMPLVYWLHGVRRFWIFAILNKPSNTARHGLIDNYPAASTPTTPFLVRPALTTVGRIISILQDPGSSFTPDSLAYNLSGSGATSDLLHLLLQKRNGTFYLVMVYDGQSHDLGDADDLDLSASVTLSFPNGAVSQVRTATPHTSSTFTTVGSNTSSVNLTVPDHLMIVEITP